MDTEPIGPAKEALTRGLRTLLKNENAIVVSHYQRNYLVRGLRPKDVLRICFSLRKGNWRVAPNPGHYYLFNDMRRRLKHKDTTESPLPSLLTIMYIGPG